MLYWAIVCAIAALIFGLLGFSGIAAGFATIARFLLAVFLILLVIFLLMGRGCIGRAHMGSVGTAVTSPTPPAR